MRLVFEQQFDVAGDALRELGRVFERCVEGRNLQRIYAADCGRHGFGRAAQHVYIGVVYGLVPLRRLGVDLHLAGAVLFGIVALDDVGPQHARRTEFCDLHEVVGAYREREAQLACGFLDRQSCVHQAYEVVMACRKDEGQLLDDGRTGVAEDLTRYGHHADVLVLFGLADQLCDAGEALLAVGRAEVAFGREALDQRVDAERDADILFGDALFFDLRQYEFGYVSRFLTAEGQLDGRNADLAKQRVEVGGGESLRRDAEAERIDACVEDLQRLGVCLLGAYDAYGLMYAPAVVCACTPYVRELACLRAQKLDAFEVLGAVVGTDVESFARFPYQFALVISTFQVGRNHFLPLLGRDRREFGEQLFTFGICHNYLEISISVVSKLLVKVQNY